MPKSTADYSELNEMFRHLQSLEQGSPPFQRQRDEIFEHSLKLADHIARRYRGRGEPFDDLVQAARAGLVSAVNRFDVDNGADFLSFAVPTMLGEVRRHFRDHTWAIKVPRKIKDVQPQLISAAEVLSQRLGRAPTIVEIADYLGLARELVVDATIGGAHYSTISTDMPAGGDDDRPVSHAIGVVDLNLEKVLDIETVRPLIAALPERQRTVLTLRFFENLSQTQIAERIGCSQMHVSRILAKALETVRSNASESTLAAAG
ncbi:SigB/SigF/SigG family RNA polymerase sigma factor [Mycolicibacterium helvum]|uniref:RNA polymerase sigma factor SigF n=1 Tax=Mycolicibacterium helvum TaxID=1534349 RepID=A0A7I7T1F9_9MYCO|nr:SigB/SigF/SigG family RNA polymerase sigma factor [Mycolicibacterium helvum]BBY63114.1 RNA polymerase sigma factor SigF [Mycolicibacterium helvum]